MKSQIISNGNNNHIVDLISENYKDSLTGLLNRTRFEEELKFLTFIDKSTSLGHALCYIDLDSFKVINEIYGHKAGDSLICSIATILHSTVRHNDCLARLGGNEFGLIIKHCNLDTALNIANTIKESIRLFRGKIKADYFGISASIGIVMINSETNNIYALLQQADVACFTAKRAGGGRVQVYQDNDKQINLQHNDMKWSNRINKALDKNQFCLYAQPIVPLSTSEKINSKPACEILLRMKDETGNIIFPNKFLPVAIRYNLASRVDNWVVKSSIDCLSRFPEYTNQCSMVTINLTGQSIGDEEFLDDLISNLKVANFNTSLLCFEITETAAIDDMPAAIHFINTIKNNFSCQFALDDFGSGFASYKYIRELPVDIVKIDGEFVKNMMTDPVSKILIQSLNDIAQVCHKKTIAEWVEDKVIFDELKTIKVDYVQGFYLGKPIPIDEYMTQPENSCDIDNSVPSSCSVVEQRQK